MKMTCLEKYSFMTRRHISVLMGAALVVLSLGACKEKPPKEKSYCQKYPGQCETVMDVKSYFSFKVGSWWVFEEEITHERDSLYVTEYANDPDSPEFTTRIHSSFQDYDYVFYPLYSLATGCSYNGISSQRCVYIHRAKTRLGDYVGEDYCFFIQNKKGDFMDVTNVTFPNDKITISEIYEDFNLGEQTFGKTIKIFEDHTYIENNNPTNHFFAKGVGLVRKELLDSNQVWNLVSYHIEP